MTTIYRPEFIAAAAKVAAAADKARPYLNCVVLQQAQNGNGAWIVATNGSVLFAGFDAECAEVPGGYMMLQMAPRDAAKCAKASLVTICGDVAGIVSSRGARDRVFIRDIQSEYSFPDWHRVLNGARENAADPSPCLLGPKVARLVSDVAKAAGAVAVTVSGRGEDPLWAPLHGTKGPAAMVIMPCVKSATDANAGALPTEYP